MTAVQIAYRLLGYMYGCRKKSARFKYM